MRLKLPEPGYLIYCAANASSSVLWLIGGIGLATLGLVVLSGLWAGAESDAAALERQRSLINQRLHEQVDQVAEAIDQVSSGYMALLSSQVSRVPSPVSSGDALASEVAGPESAETISKIVVAVFGYDQAFVVDGNGQLAMRSGPEVEARYRWIRPLLLPLLRERQPGANPARRMSNNNVLANSSESSSRRGSFAELMRLEGRPTIAGIAPINRAEDLSSRELPLTSQDMRYLIAIRFLDGAALDDLSREQGLNGARFARSADPDPNEVAVQIDAGATGEPIGFIVWSPDLPGSRVIGRLLPALLGAALVIAVLFLLLLKRLRTSLIELKLSEANARHLASHDVLTALPNRAYFSAQLEDCLAQKPVSDQRSAIALIDLDRFKAVNDRFGHAAGDELIRTAAERMRSVIGPADVLARIGGDEFALLICNSGREETTLGDKCKALVSELSRPFHLRAGEVVAHIGGSAGMTLLPPSGGSASEILRQADVALYEAKNQGRGRSVLFQPDMEEGRDAREALKGELRKLLENSQDSGLGQNGQSASTFGFDENFGKLDLYYQTIHHASDGYRPSGAEALIRWHHPRHGFLAPDEFIPLAEEGGLLELLGRWVLREACSAAAKWSPDTFVAVNVSPSQLRVPGFEDVVETVLLETGLPPSRLELEVTESALIEDSRDIAGALRRLRARGVQVSLDDFGTGYSSLSHLMHFGIDRIKIDRSFVALLGARADGAALVSGLLSLARTLSISTTAEGVETEAQRDFLVALGCTDLQGFLFSKPMPLGELQARSEFSPRRSGELGRAQS
ncbi:EAL domain-containing protein [Tianweitania sp.]|uniref:EAL domain-containing protein n=1 Tax=Tianweitania sp. TaxID=2021634 RepID=UPI0028987FCC|nr:EAL domain-containing protein [Tianweitania sp.]